MACYLRVLGQSPQQSPPMPLDQDALQNLRIERTTDPKLYRAPSRRLIWIGGAGIAVAALLLFLFLRNSAPVVQTAVAQGAAADGQSAVLNASGYVVARRLATVSSKVTGKIVEVRVEEGASVAENEVLARLDDTTARAQLDLAQRQLDVAGQNLAEVRVRIAEAQRNLTRTIALRRDNLVSETALDSAQSEAAALAARLAALQGEVKVAESNVRVRRRDLDDLVIRAPFAGVVISKDAQPGEMVSPISAGGGYTRTGIATIVDMDSREIEVDVNESFINRVQPAQRAEAVLDAYPDLILPAHVINIVPAADRQKATVRVRIGFESLDPRILPDMGVKVRFLESARPGDNAPRALATVPSQAIEQAEGKSYLWIVKSGTLERRAVSTGHARDGQIEVMAGIRAGETVVAPIVAGLRDGARIQVKE